MDGLQFPTTPLGYVLASLAGFLTLTASTFIAYFLGRKQTNALTENTKADTEKTKAETVQIESITARDNTSLMLTLIKEVAAQTLRAQRLNDDRENLENKVSALQGEIDLLRLELDQRIRVNPSLPPFSGEE